MPALNATWRKSTRSNNGGACVEVRYLDGRIEVRDSKDRTGPTLAFTPQEWTAFLAGVNDLEFELS